MKIQLLNEGGGIGDVLRRMGVVRSIKAAIPDAEVWFFVEDKLADWVRLDRSMSYVVAIPASIRRSIHTIPDPEQYGYLDIGLPYDYTIDLWDPSETYENQAFDPITRNRGVTWRNVASAVLGCPLELQLCELTTDPFARMVAHKQLTDKLGPLKTVVGLQPFSYWRWRSLSHEQVRAIVTLLRLRGIQCVLFHHSLDGISELVDELKLATVVGAPPIVLAEMLRLCRAVITGDSGFFHIAGMLGVPALGVFGQTNGTAIGSDYPTCRTITAGPAEREGLACDYPCYRRASFGCSRIVCEKGCQASGRVSAIRIVDEVMKFMDD